MTMMQLKIELTQAFNRLRHLESISGDDRVKEAIQKQHEKISYLQWRIRNY